MNDINYSTCFSTLAAVPKYLSALYANDVQFLGLLADTAAKLTQDPDWFGVQACANILHALAKISNALVPPFNHFKPVFLAISSSPTLLQRIADNANPQELANILWAYATASMDGSEVYKSFEGQAARLATDGDPQALANSAWAYASARYAGTGKIFEQVGLQCVRLVQQGDPQAVAITVWAFSTMNYQHQVSERASERAEWNLLQPPTSKLETDPTHSIRRSAQGLFEEVAKVAGKISTEGRSQNLVNTAWAFANSSFYAPGVFGAIAKQCDKVTDENSSQALSKLSWSFAISNNHFPELFAKVASKSQLLATEGALKGLATASWAFAVVGNWTGESSVLIGRLWSKLCQPGPKNSPKAFNEEDMWMVYQVLVASKVEVQVSER